MKRSCLLTVIGLLLMLPVLAQQPGSIRGKIITADEKPAEGVTIIIKNTAKIAIADNNGVYEIKNVLSGSYTLLVSLIGFRDEEREVTFLTRKKR